MNGRHGLDTKETTSQHCQGELSVRKVRLDPNTLASMV